MKLTPPSKVTLWLALLLGVLGVLGYAVRIPLVTTYAFLFLLVGFVLLALGVLVKKM